MQNKDTSSSARLLSRKAIETTNYKESSRGKYAVPFLSQPLNYQIKRLVPISNPDIARVRPSAPPATVPSAPTITTITGANTRLTVNFTSGSTGGSPITDYEYSSDNGSTWTSSAQTTSPVVISGLTNGTLYNVKLRAINSVGTSTESSPETGTPTATLQTFTTPLDSPIAWLAPTDIFFVEYLIVGGGGGGGNGYDTGGGGGGGGGMVLTGTLSIIPNTTYSVTVGGGGSGGANARTNNNGADGNSSIFHTITALGGGFGKGSRTQTGASGLGGDGASNPTTASIGGSGGGNQGTLVGGCGGGGGGAGGDGTNGIGAVNSPGSGGTGGIGVSSSISGSSQTYGVGGNGARGNTNVSGTNGGANTGNGGSAGSHTSGFSNGGGNGGSGIVIIKY
jgi:hypothetical protein